MVKLNSEKTLPFISIFSSDPSPIGAQATAALVDQGKFCVISLHSGNQTGIEADGTGAMDFGCGLKSNSTAEEAVRAGGSSVLNATSIAAVGGLNGATSNFGPGTRLQPHSTPEKDPLDWVPDPPRCGEGSGEPNGAIQSGGGEGAFLDEQMNLRTKPGSNIALAPGCYTSLDLQGTALMTPGTYYVYGGDVRIGAQAQLVGLGITIVMTGPNGLAGNLRMDGGSSVDLSSPGSGNYRGVVFYRDRRAPKTEIQMTGGSSSRLTGAFYFPTSDITFTGHAGMDVECLQMVGQIMRFRGTANITNQCPADSGAEAFHQTVIRLVS